MELWGLKYFHYIAYLSADATASIGRNTTTRTINRCEEVGIDVVYGDTDSLFLKIHHVTKLMKCQNGPDLILG